jgi:hypothetical protein
VTTSVGTSVTTQTAPDPLEAPLLSPEADADRVTGADRVRSWLRRPVVAGLLLLVVYAGLSFALNDPRGTLGTDTGGKLATLHEMDRTGSLVPDVGYWAQQWDPKGVLHPLHYTYDIGGHWVNVTTLPMLEAAYPLYHLGGDRAVLLLPMLGAVLCAFAARALARRFVSDTVDRERAGWYAFWVVGLASPVAVYALDFWEHTIGLALMLWALVHLLDVLDRRDGWRGRWPGALAAGLLFGAAATMRTESLVYLVVGTGLTCLVMLWRERSLVRPVTTGICTLVGAGVMVGANRMLEQVLLGTDLRGARVAGTASGAGTTLGNRAHEAATTAVGTGMTGLRSSSEWIVGTVVVVLVALGAWGMASLDRRRVALGTAAFAAGCVVYLVRFSQGWGFVPGLLIASPFAAVGLFLAWRRPALRLPAAIACAALPVAWYAQYQGGADPQWGGRYILLSGVLLTTAGVVVLRRAPRAFVAVVALATVTTAMGIGWLSVRSNTTADGMAQIVAREDQVLISRQTHMLREGGAFYDSTRHWLTATTPAQLREAVRIAHESGATELALVGGDDQRPPATLGDYSRGETRTVSFIRPDVHLQVTTYHLG